MGLEHALWIISQQRELTAATPPPRMTYGYSLIASDKELDWRVTEEVGWMGGGRLLEEEMAEPLPAPE